MSGQLLGQLPEDRGCLGWAFIGRSSDGGGWHAAGRAASFLVSLTSAVDSGAFPGFTILFGLDTLHLERGISQSVLVMLRCPVL